MTFKIQLEVLARVRCIQEVDFKGKHKTYLGVSSRNLYRANTQKTKNLLYTEVKLDHNWNLSFSPVWKGQKGHLDM